MADAFICDAVRTPIGRYGGALSSVRTDDLGAIPIAALLQRNTSLDPGSRNWGYTVFGEVVSGMEVLEAIAEVQTGYSEALDAEDVPLEPVLLIKASVNE